MESLPLETIPPRILKAAGREAMALLAAALVGLAAILSGLRPRLPRAR